jgi:2,3-bisphosphoglycerate-independent phosphoglycerate mutase
VKYAVIIISGLAGEPSEDLSGETALEAADAPRLRELAASGRVGGVVTLPPGAPESTSIALASLLGIDTSETPTPAGPLLARALGVAVEPGSVFWRLTLRSSASPGAALTREAVPSREETERLIASLQGFADHAGVTLRTGGPGWGVGVTADDHEQRASAFLDAASGALTDHEVNAARRDAGLPTLDHPLLDESGAAVELAAYAARYRLSAALASADETALSLAEAMKIEALHAADDPRGEINALAEAATEALDRHDVAIVRTSHSRRLRDLGDDVGLAAHLAEIDRGLVAPIADRLAREGGAESDGGGGWRLLVVGDLGAEPHESPAPFLFAGDWVRSIVRRPFTEAGAAESDLIVDPGCDLMEYVLRSGLKGATITRGARAT